MYSQSWKVDSRFSYKYVCDSECATAYVAIFFRERCITTSILPISEDITDSLRKWHLSKIKW